MNSVPPTIRAITARPTMTFCPVVKAASARRARPRAELSVSALKGRRATSYACMFMIVFSAVTALSVNALASCVSRSASVDATVASATLALPAAASSETLVALLVAPLSESIAWPSMFANEPDEAASVALPAAEDGAAACAAPRDWEAPMDGMEGMAGIIASGLDVEDGLVGIGGVRHDLGVGLVRRLRLDQGCY